MPARHRRSSSSRTSSRDEKVSATFNTRKMPHTGCDTSNAPLALAAPVAVLAVLNFGVFGVVGLVALSGVVAILARRGRPAVGLRDAVTGIAVVGLVLGAMFAALTNTQTICWNARSTPTGVVYERIPVQQEFGPIGGDTGIVASGCAGGQPTIEGTALTSILLVGAIAIAAEAARTGRSPDA